MRFCQSYVADLLSNAQFMFTEKTSFPNIVILGVKKKLRKSWKTFNKNVYLQNQWSVFYSKKLDTRHVNMK